MVPVLQIRQQGHREVKYLDQDHLANNFWIQDWNQGLVSATMFLLDTVVILIQMNLFVKID